MARVNPTAPTNPPSPPIQRGDRATFSARVDQTITYLTGAPAEIYGLAQNTYNNAVDAFGSAGAAATSAGAAAGSATSASGFADDASDFADAASASATAASGSATAAANSAASLTATSTSSLVIGAGAKAFTVQAGRQFSVGQSLRAVNPTNTAQWMVGTVTSYSGTALVLDVTDVNPATAGQTAANWSINISGVKGATGSAGGITGGNLTGALNYAQAGAVPVSATPDIWSGAGNLVPLTGTGTITGFPAAPQLGATRTLVVGGDTTLTSGANLQVYGGTVALGAGDLVDVVADSGSVFRATVRRRDGAPVNQDRGALHNLRVFESSGMFTATKTGWHKITCIGGSGSAGAAAGRSGNGTAATGGGAGGLCQALRFLTAGVTYMANVGNGGAAPAAASAVFDTSSTASNGNAGGNTTFSGAGIATMTANGGGGGKAQIGNGAIALTGGTGGSASGGDLNVKGGDGGTIISILNGAAAATGGGAVGLRGGSFNGGDATATTAAVYISGGAGVGGKGGDSVAGTAITAGGGAAGAASGATAGANYKGVAGGAAFAGALLNDLDAATGGGNVPGASADAPAGGGSAGRNGGTHYKGGVFAGTGGFATVGANVNLTGVAGGQYGGAPGGVAATISTSSITVNGVAGSAGGVWIEF